MDWWLAALAIWILVAVYLIYYGLSNSSRSWGGGSALARYSRDLTKLARERKLDPVIGRHEEIMLVIQILSRRNKNNPVLVGRAGVGKTAIAEGLAAAITARRVPPTLYNKRVLALDLPALLAGTKYRGEFEQRLKRVTDEISQAQRQIILFIDEIHILAEAGEAEGAINAADILKPLLARGDLQVVGATTGEEYEKFIKQDKTLDRRLHPVFVEEPSPAETLEILAGLRQTYQRYHRVIIQPAALKAAVQLTKSFKSQAYPDKAIDAIDEACSLVTINEIKQSRSRRRTTLTVTATDIKVVTEQWRAQRRESHFK